MCLFPPGGGGFNMQPRVPPSDRALAAKRPLSIIMWVHLGLAVTMLFSGAGGIQDLFLVLILWCAITQFHYCQLIIYMMFSMFQWVNLVCLLGLLIQRGEFSSYLSAGGKSTFRMLLVMTMTVFYPTSLFFAFRAYREFKGLFYDNGMMGGGNQGGIAGFLGLGGGQQRPGSAVGAQGATYLAPGAEM